MDYRKDNDEPHRLNAGVGEAIVCEFQLGERAIVSQGLPERHATRHSHAVPAEI